MRAILTMTLNDLRIFFSQRGNWLSLTLLPILFTVGLGFAFSRNSGPETLRVDILDEDRSTFSMRFLEQLRETNETLVLCPFDDEPGDRCALDGGALTLAQSQERVREGVSAALIVIPAGFGSAFDDPAGVEIGYYSASAATVPDPVRQTVETVLQRVNSATLTARVVDAMLERSDVQRLAGDSWVEAFVRSVYTKTETLMAQRPPAVHYVTTATAGANEEGNENEGVEGFTQSVPGVGSMYVMFTVFGGMTLLQRERQRWTLQRLAVFPLTRGQILAGKILTYFTLGMLQYLIVFAIGLVVGLDFGPNPFLLLPVMAAFVLCCTALTFAVAPLLASEQQAGVMAQLFALTFASLGGAWWPLEIVPAFMQFIGHLTPVAWVMDAFADLLFYNGSFATILPELGVLVASAAVLFGVGIWRFRYMN